MEQILIYKSPEIHELLNDFERVSIITSAEHRKESLGEDVISITVESSVIRSFEIGDYIQLTGLPKYYINQKPDVTKISSRKYEYQLQFEGPQYSLARVSFRNTDVLSVNMASDFSLIGDMQMFLNVIINNLNRVFGANKWALGDYPISTETKNLLFNTDNCLSVLQMLCEEYKYQFAFTESSTQTILHVRKVGINLGMTFKYGFGSGLYSLTRQNVDTSNMVNTLWAYGSTKNLPPTYKNGAPRLRLSVDYDLPVIENTSFAAYGTFEGSIIFEDIYPHRTGTVTAIDEENKRLFKDIDIDFDLNEKVGDKHKYLIPGNDAKVVFQTGNLAGYEFSVNRFISETKSFVLNPNKDEKGTEMPSNELVAFQINIGDTYVLVDIIMPQSYVDDAEDALELKAVEFLNERAHPTVKYSLNIDEFYLEEAALGEPNVFDIGDTVVIQDSDLAINSQIKISSFTRNLLKPYKYELVIQDTPSTNIIRTFKVQNRYFNNILEAKKLTDPRRALGDWRSDIQIIGEIPKFLNDTPTLPIGENSDIINFGKLGKEAIAKMHAALELLNQDNYGAEFKVDGLTKNIRVEIPEPTTGDNLVLNDWDYLIGKPEIIENTFSEQPANQIFASPNGTDGLPEFRSMVAADLPTVPTNKLADGTEFLKRNGSVAYTGIQDFGGNKAINLGTPVNPTDAARLVDIQNFQAGLTAKEAVRVATTANITLSGAQTIDGVSVIAGNRVLVKNQTTASQNGIYVCAAGAWARSADADTSAEVRPSTFVFVSEGTTNADSAWMLTTDAPIVLGTTALTWVQFSGAGQITATAGISKTGNTLTADLSYLDTKYPSLTASRAQNTVFAGPLSGSGVASFRTLGAADIPALAISGITGLQNALDTKHTGAGTSGYLSKYTGALTLANSLLYDNGTNVGVGNADPTYKLDVTGTGRFTSDVTFGANAILATAPTNGNHLTNKTYVDGKTWAISAVTGLQTALDAKLSGSGTSGYLSKYTGALTMAASGVFESGGALGLGTTDLADGNLKVFRNITGAASAASVQVRATVQSDVTTAASGFVTNLNTQAASFSFTSLNHFYANQPSFGAGSSVTNQYGFRVGSSLTGGVNNFGFHSDIAAGTGRWNLYMGGTANNYIAGNLWIGTASSAYKLDVNGTGNFTGDVTFGGNAILANAPTTGNHLTNKTYVDGKNWAISAVTGLQTSLDNRWTLGGNALGSTGAIGSTTNQNVQLLHNSVVGFTLKTDGITDVKGLAVGRASGFGGSSWDTIAVFGGSVTIGGNNSAALGSYDLNMVAHTTVDNPGNATRKSRIKFGYYSGADFADRFSRVIEYRRIDGAIVIGSYSSVISNTATTDPTEANSVFFSSSGHVSIGVNSTSFKLSVSGTGNFTGDVTFGGNAILANAPTIGNHLTNKSYVDGKTWAISAVTGLQTALDAKLSGIGTSGYLSKYTGALTQAASGVYESGGALGLGTTDLADGNLKVFRNITGAASAASVQVRATVQSDVTTAASGFVTNLNTQAASFSFTSLNHFYANQPSFGAGSSVTNQYGFRVGSSLTGGVNNFGFHSDIAAGTGRWNLYMGGTANNYIAGNLWIGTTSSSYKLDVNGTGRFTGNTLFGADIDITGKLKLGGNVGTNRQVIKSDGTNTSWATLSTTDLSDNSNIVMLGDYDGERGFRMYSNSAKDFLQGFVFSNPDAGVALSLHAYGLDGANNIKEFGLLMDTDGLLYHQKLDGLRSQIATVDMLGSGGGGVWNGGNVTNDINLSTYTTIFFNKTSTTEMEGRIVSMGGNGLLIQSTGNLGLSTTEKYITLTSNRRSPGYGDNTGVVIDGVIIDLNNVASLVGGNAKFTVTNIGGEFNYYKISLIAG